MGVLLVTAANGMSYFLPPRGKRISLIDSTQDHQDKPPDSDGHEHCVSIWRAVQRG